MVTRRRFLTLAGAAALPLPSFALAGDLVVHGGDAFGSYWRLSLPPGGGEASAETVARIVHDVDLVFSPYREDSELTRFNRAGGDMAIELSEAFADVLAQSLAIAAASGGAFDPTVGPLVRRFGFGPIEGNADISCRDLRLEGRSAVKRAPGLSLDLCGIAKGHALDRIAAALDARGLQSYLLDLGGEVLARGHHPQGRRWQVAVEPRREPSRRNVVLRLADQAVATSGNSVQSFRVGNRRLGHIIDPRRRRPAEGKAETVTVAAESAARADGWATALLAMDAQEAIATAGALGIDALFVMKDEADGPIVTTGRFDRLIAI